MSDIKDALLVHSIDNNLLDNLPIPSQTVEPRSIFIRLNTLESIKGSAYMEYGNTKVMAFVQPPRRVVNQRYANGIPCQVNCAITFVPKVIDDLQLFKDRSGLITKTLKKVLESSICREQYANMQLDIKVTVLEDDGCVLSTAINCCGVALVVAGIPMFDIITASTVGYYKGIEYYNPDASIEKLFKPINEPNSKAPNYGIVTASSFPSLNQITGCIQKGLLTQNTFVSLLNHISEINEKISESIKYVLLENIKELLATKQNSTTNDDDMDD